MLSGVKITSLPSLAEAITTIHKTYSVPHVIITSVQLSNLDQQPSTTPPPNNLTVIGSTTQSTGSPRLFRIDVPALDCFFSGTGDMFAALMVARLREAVVDTPALGAVKSWVSPDGVRATDLPLARAAVKVLASMHSVLEKTLEARERELEGGTVGVEGVGEEERARLVHLRRTKAAEVRLVRNVRFLREPVVQFEAKEWMGEDLPDGLR